MHPREKGARYSGQTAPGLLIALGITAAVMATPVSFAQENAPGQTQEVFLQLMELQKDYENDLVDIKDLEENVTTATKEMVGNRREMNQTRQQIADVRKELLRKKKEIETIKKQAAAMGREKTKQELLRLAQKKNLDRQAMMKSLKPSGLPAGSTSESLQTSSNNPNNFSQQNTDDQREISSQPLDSSLPELASLPEGTSDQGNSNTSALAHELSQLGEALEADSMLDENERQGTVSTLSEYAVSKAVSEGTETAEALLSGLGKAQIELLLDEGLQVETLGVDYLLPFIENQRTLGFAQLGYWDRDGSSTLNIGLGVRRFGYNTMWGANVFLDTDLTQGHRRGSLGLEGMIGFLKGYSNVYVPLSDWKNVASSSAALEAKAASGIDVGLEVHIQQVPGLSITAEYSQWYGEHVDLSGNFGDSAGMDDLDTLSSDSSEASFTVDYRPIPLLGISYERTIDFEGGGDREIGIDLSWDFDLALSKHFKLHERGTTGNVNAMRREFVTRESSIVLQYREDPDMKRGTGNVLNAGHDVIRGFLYGDSYTQSATGTDGGKLSYKSDDESVATVDDTGKVTILNAGQTTIRVREEATEITKEESDEYLLTISTTHSGLVWDDRNNDISSNGVVTRAAGSAPFQIEAVSTLAGSGSDGAISYAILGNSAIASIDADDGTVTPGMAGSVTVRASQERSSDGSYHPTHTDYILQIGKVSAQALSWQSASPSGHSIPAVYGQPVTGDVAVPATHVTGRILYSTDRPDLLAVDPNTGDLKILGSGQPVVSARLVNDPNVQNAEINYTVDIAKADPVAMGVAYWSSTVPDGGDVHFIFGTPPPTTTASIIEGVSPGYTSGTVGVADIDAKNATLTVHMLGQSVISATWPETTNYTTATITYILNSNAESNLAWDQADPAKGSVKTEYGLDIAISASATDATGPILYRSDNPSIASIDRLNGTVTPVGIGTTKLYATQKSDGDYAETTVETEIEIITGTPTLTWNDNNVEKTKSVSKKYHDDGYTYQLKISTNSPGTISYESNSIAVSVDRGNGTVTFLDAATIAQIKATVAATSKFNSGSTYYDLDLQRGDGDPLKVIQQTKNVGTQSNVNLDANVEGGNQQYGAIRRYKDLSNGNCTNLQGNHMRVLCMNATYPVEVYEPESTKFNHQAVRYEITTY